MLQRFLPKQEEFFSLFKKMGGCLTQAAQALRKEIAQLSQPNSNTQLEAEEVLHYKRETGTHAQRSFTLLHKTFITPFDRYDIHRLNATLYDIANMINLIAQRFVHYDIRQVPATIVTLTDVCFDSVKLVDQVMQQLNQLKHHAEIVADCQKIKALESQADHLLIDGVATLLRDEQDVRAIIKLKEVYDLLETVTDRCQEVAFIVEGIVLEYA